MGKRKFKKGRAVFDEITSKREEKLFETEYWKKLAKAFNKLKKGLSRASLRVKKWQE